VEGETRN